MAIVPSSDPAQYRVTFFFGPEAVEERPDHLRCVFNVKKRSWKGGVQVAVDVARRHLDRARERLAMLRYGVSGDTTLMEWRDEVLQDEFGEG